MMFLTCCLHIYVHLYCHKDLCLLCCLSLQKRLFLISWNWRAKCIHFGRDIGSISIFKHREEKVLNEMKGRAPGDSSYVISCVFHTTLSINASDLPLDVQGAALSACYQEPAEVNRKDLWRLESSPPSFQCAVLCAEVRNPGGSRRSTPAPVPRLWQGLLWPPKICQRTQTPLYSSWRRQHHLQATIKKDNSVVVSVEQSTQI